MMRALVCAVAVLCVATVRGENGSHVSEKKGRTDVRRAEESGPGFLGDPSCPCLEGDSDALNDLHPDDVIAAQETDMKELDLSTYGVGCEEHDNNRPVCKDDTSCTDVFPVADECDRSWCVRSWCFIDAANCKLLHKRTSLFPKSDRYYSYATCHDMDSYTKNNRIASLNEQVLRVGYNSNSGGWAGAYSDDGTHFRGPATRWSGPTVNFVHEAAKRGSFRIAVTEPPSFLVNKSIEFFSPSKFDLCVYATALGYTDLCVSQYSVTDQRALSTNWFLLSNDPVYLIVFTDAGMSPLRQFIAYFETIFQPFTPATWYFLIFVVCPVMGVLMLVHEYGKAGSSYPSEESVVIEEDSGHGSTRSFKNRRISFWSHIPKSIFVSFLSLLQQSYSQSIVTVGGMLNLLGVSFFILTIIAVYTANLAAILTQQARTTDVDSIEAAIQAGYTFCGERKVAGTVMDLYSIADRFVPDPVELGGDGDPGFNCANCKSRLRVFENMARDTGGSDLYCDAAIAPLEDLEVLFRDGRHCDKTPVGDPLSYVQSGLPVYDGVSQGLISLMLNMKNDGVFDKELRAAKPNNNCPPPEEGEGTALSIPELTGIWVVSFGFAFAGLLVRCCQRQAKRAKKNQTDTNKREMRMSVSDQWGQSKSDRRISRLRSFSFKAQSFRSSANRGSDANERIGAKSLFSEQTKSEDTTSQERNVTFSSGLGKRPLSKPIGELDLDA